VLADHHAHAGAPQLEQRLTSSSRVAAPELSALVDEVLRPAVAALRKGLPYVASRVDRRPMRDLCAAAHAGDIRAEALILAIKDRWRRVPECYGENRTEAETALAAVITCCIGEYYEPRRP
jgi:hypothetical protein